MKLGKRMGQLNSGGDVKAVWAKMNEGIACFQAGLAAGPCLAPIGVNSDAAEWPNPSWEHLAGMYIGCVIGSNKAYCEASEINKGDESDPVIERYIVHCKYFVYAVCFAARPKEKLGSRAEEEESWGGDEASLVQAVSDYVYEVKSSEPY